jgi:hypothetical protein
MQRLDRAVVFAAVGKATYFILEGAAEVLYQTVGLR